MLSYSLSMNDRLTKLTVLLLIYMMFLACRGSGEKAGTGSDTLSSRWARGRKVPDSTGSDTTKQDSSVPEPDAKPNAAQPATSKPFRRISGETKSVTHKPAPDHVNPDIKTGEMLTSNAACSACHMADTRLVGPSYKEIAQKYEPADKSEGYLADKIINGGAGVWGEVFMPPHPSVPQEEARAMARYILSLK
jgi:cytochrome c